MVSIVVDTSVVVKWLNQDNEQDIDKADKILHDVSKGTARLLAPELVKYEVANVLLCGKKLTAKQARICLAAFYGLPITFVGDNEQLTLLTYNIAEKCGITYYDASFMAIAKDFDATLITDNVKHQGKAPDIAVIALKDYQ